mgnify:CR=1 FL=1
MASIDLMATALTDLDAEMVLLMRESASAMADKYADLGPLYHPTAKLREMAANGQRFYG